MTNASVRRGSGDDREVIVMTGDRQRREAGDAVRGDVYGEGVLDEITEPTDDVAEAKRRDWGDVADVPVDAETLRDGGPTRSGGAVTTTGGNAGPASVPRRRNDQAGPTTTGDATSGGMGTGPGGSTSDNTTRG
jgi:hypothetical protein